MAPLSYGLNLPKKSGSAAAIKRKPIFDDDSGPEDGLVENALEVIETIGGLQPTSTVSKANEPDRVSASKSLSNEAQIASHFIDLSTSHSTSKHAAEAQEVDPSVYDYDGVYDSLHAKTKKSGGSSGPKYMANLLAAAEVRKRDQLRAKEKMLAKEREAEGDDYADKEKFVTAAYRTQQEEVRRLEEEERKREEEEVERKRRSGGGMQGLYKGLLAREEARHEAAVNAVGTGKIKEGDINDPKEKSEADIAKETGAIVNDEGQVVDKRQLLQAGLNVRPKPKSLSIASSKSSSIKPSTTMLVLQGHSSSKAAMRERQSRMLEAQLEESAKRVSRDQDVEREALQRAAKSRKTGVEINSARERYLQRKREAEAAKSSGKGA